MNNYYFIVGGSAAWAEIVRILQEKKIPFAWMKSDTEGAVSVPYEKIDEVIAAGVFRLLSEQNAGVRMLRY